MATCHLGKIQLLKYCLTTRICHRGSVCRNTSVQWEFNDISKTITLREMLILYFVQSLETCEM